MRGDKIDRSGVAVDNDELNHIESYLSGVSFSDELSCRPQIISHSQSRGDVLVQWVAGRRVLHVGFADHAPLIASRVADGSWLHSRLTRSASICEGIDINRASVDIARSLGFENVHALDIFSPDTAATLAQWRPDLVLVPDVIEHLSNPATFMRRLAQCLPAAEFVVTVPNALSLRNAAQAMKGVERINTDHRAWFSPFTLLKVLADAGLQAESLHGCTISASGSIKGWLLRALAH